MYEEAIQTVMTVRDFTQVFDSYAQFEESMIAAKMETNSEMGREEDGKSSLARRKQMLLLLFKLDRVEQVTQFLSLLKLSDFHQSGLPRFFGLTILLHFTILHYWLCWLELVEVGVLQLVDDHILPISILDLYMMLDVSLCFITDNTLRLIGKGFSLFIHPIH